ncbi:hypothetical protein FRC06_006852 [Ceratobasidium sp. 370]|nr:hypothetical protein FRC06_006852 [Ceratobasidium sp. 370]
MQVVLGLFWIDLLGSAQPILCRFIEDELESSIAILKTSGQESVDQFTLISQKLGSLIAAPRLLVQWKERPWDHVYQPIRQGIRKLIDSEREVLQVSFSGRTNQPTRVSEFQKRLLDRIRDHAKRVESYGLGSTTKIQDEMETRISQVWVLIRPDDTTPTPAEASAPTTAQPEIRELTVPPLDLDDPTEPSSPSPSIDHEQSPPSPGRFDEDGELRKRFKGVPPVDDEFMPDEGPSGFVHQYTGERRFYY